MTALTSHPVLPSVPQRVPPLLHQIHSSSGTQELPRRQLWQKDPRPFSPPVWKTRQQENHENLLTGPHKRFWRLPRTLPLLFALHNIPPRSERQSRTWRDICCGSYENIRPTKCPCSLHSWTIQDAKHLNSSTEDAPEELISQKAHQKNVSSICSNQRKVLRSKLTMSRFRLFASCLSTRAAQHLKKQKA